MISSENNIEVITKDFLLETDGLKTELLAQRFSNRIFITVSQCNGFGSLINISKDELGAFTSENSNIGISVDFLMGVEENIYKTIARQIAAVVFRESSSPILVAIALKDRSPKYLKDIMSSLDKVNVWG